MNGEDTDGSVDDGLPMDALPDDSADAAPRAGLTISGLTSGLIEGLISVQAVLDARSRPIEQIYMRADKRDREAAMLLAHAVTAGVPIERVGAAALDEIAQGRTHGGVVARVGERQFATLDALIAGADTPLVVMLDGVEDPYNFGQAVRAFYAAGADGLVVRPRNWMSAAGVVARASAGASERLPTAISESAEAAADFYRARGLLVACADQTRARSLYDVDLSVPMFLLIGGERRGVTRSFADKADLRIRIPYGRAFAHALDTTSAAAALAFEIMRQRRYGQPPAPPPETDAESERRRKVQRGRGKLKRRDGDEESRTTPASSQPPRKRRDERR